MFFLHSFLMSALLVNSELDLCRECNSDTVDRETLLLGCWLLLQLYMKSTVL